MEGIGMYPYEAFSLLTSIALLAYASIEDVKKREISDRIWLIFTLFGLATRAIDLAYFPNLGHFLDIVISIAIPTILFLGLFYLGLFGGADAKALICIALSNPKPPSSLPLLVGYLLPYYSLSIFDNSVILSLSIIPLNLAFNLSWLISGRKLFEGLEEEATWKKVVAFFTCRKARSADVRSSPSFCAAEVVKMSKKGESKRCIRLVYRLGDDNEELLPDSEYVLAHYTIPLIVFVTMGFLASVLIGDIIIMLIGDIVGPFL
jgi:preflagellin peptidase FlaK